MTKWSVRPWETLINRAREWERHQAALAQVPVEHAQRGRLAFVTVGPRVCDFAIARGARLRAEIEPIAPVIVAMLAEDAGAAGEGRVRSAVDLRLVDTLGVVASTGIALPAAAFDQARAILAAVATRPEDERASDHWARGLAAIALDQAAVSRDVIGPAVAAFDPAATFGADMHGFVAHLAGAVEGGAPAAACLPAWSALLEQFHELRTAQAVSSACLFWAGWIVHHRLDGQPIGTLAAWLHETLYRAAGVAP